MELVDILRHFRKNDLPKTSQRILLWMIIIMPCSGPKILGNQSRIRRRVMFQPDTFDEEVNPPIRTVNFHPLSPTGNKFLVAVSC